MTLALLAIALYYAWRYSLTEIDPDWAYFNMWAFTGARYGRDFADCKMPGIHLWYRAIAKVVGANIQRVKFTHTLLVSLPGVIVGGWAGLAYIVLINSGVLMAFHGNVGQPAAGFVFLAMWLNQPIASSLLVLLAVGFESKLAPVVLLLSLASGWWMGVLPALLLAGGAALLIRWRWPQVWAWLWEANITLPRRITKYRYDAYKKHTMYLFPWYTSHGFIYLAPWLLLAVIYNPDPLYWPPALLYLALIFAGLVVRPNHLLPLAPWIALAGTPPLIIAALVASDWIGAGLYLGDIWDRFYLGLRDFNINARKIGEYLKDKEGQLWLNNYHSAVYIYSGKPPIYGVIEQMEIRENIPERREVWRTKFKERAPDWVVDGPAQGWKFVPLGYDKVGESLGSTIYRKAAA